MEGSIQQAMQTALAHQGAGQLAQAEAIYREILRTNPDYPPALDCLGALAAAVGRHDDAERLIRRAISLGPGVAEFRVNLGALLEARGRREEAAGEFAAAIALRPELAAAHYNLGLNLSSRGRSQEAADCFGAVVRLDPNRVEAWANLGVALVAMERFAEAAAALARAIELRPSFAEALGFLGYCRFKLGEIDDAIAILRRAVELRPDLAMAQTNLLSALNYSELADRDPAAVFEEHVRWGNRQTAQGMPRGPAADHDRNPQRRPLRVGYLSPDFREHSVAYFIEPVIAAHDRAAVEVYCYSNLSQKDQDATTSRFRAIASHWRDVLALSDDQLADQIIADRMDVLVDLAGHTPGNRLGALARKPAPVQVTYLGYPNTTGLGTIDYLLTDALADPPGMTERLYTEKLIRLPDCFCCYQPPRTIADAPVAQRAAGAPITFISVNNAAKISPSTLDLWGRVLARVNGSRLIIKARGVTNASLRARLLGALAHHGIADHRVELSDWGRLGDFVETVARADIALDTFPFNGHTNTCHLLWLGAAVVSLSGRTHASRIGLSILTQVGLSDLAAGAANDYVSIAVALAEDRRRLRDLRQTLRKRVQASPLSDTRRFTQNLEAAYRRMWEECCPMS